MFVEVDSERDLLRCHGKPSVQLSDCRRDRRGEESGPRFEDARRDGAEVAGEDGLPLLLVISGRVVAGGECFADTWWAPAQPDVLVAPDGVRELRESSVLASDLERRALGQRLGGGVHFGELATEEATSVIVAFPA